MNYFYCRKEEKMIQNFQCKFIENMMQNDKEKN